MLLKISRPFLKSTGMSKTFKLPFFLVFLFSCIYLVLINGSHGWALSAQEEHTAKLIEGAKKEGELVIYHSPQQRDYEAFCKAFMKKYPFIKAKPYRASASKLMNKILMEHRAGRHIWDVCQTRGIFYQILKEEGLFQKYMSLESEVYPASYKDPDGFWTAMFRTTVVIGYNTRLVPPGDIPKSYEDLLNPKWRGKLSADKTEEEWFMNMLFYMGEKKGLEFMSKLYRQDLILQEGNTLRTSLLVAGEFPIMVTTQGHTIEYFKAQGAPVDWVKTAKPIVTYISPISLSAYAKNPNAGKLFIDFMLSKEGQEVLTSVNRIPIRPGVDANPPGLTKGVELLVSDPKNAHELPRMEKLYRDYLVKGKN